MSQIALNLATDIETSESQWKSFFRLGGAASLLQLACVIISTTVAIILGAEPTTAEEYYTVLQNDGLAGLLRLDFTTLILLTLFAVTSFAIYGALRRSNKAYASFATALIFVGMTLAIANHSAFSMIRLSDQHVAATSAAQKEQLLAAGEATIASNMWNSTGGLLAGIFMQGGFVIVSIVMLRGKVFSRGTGYSGLISNGFDLIHVLVGLFLPSLGLILLYISGPFYLVWFGLLGRDLLKLGRQ